MADYRYTIEQIGRMVWEMQAEIDAAGLGDPSTNPELGPWIHMPKADHDQILAKIDELRAENEQLRAALADIVQTLADYKQDRMWAYALRKIERLTRRPEIDAAAERERAVRT